MFKLVNSNLEDRLDFDLQSFNEIHNYSTHNITKFCLPLFKRANSQNCFCYSGPKLIKIMEHSYFQIP